MEFARLSHFFILLCLPFGLLCAHINVPINGNPDSDSDNLRIAGRVVGGHEAERGQFPYQASVRIGEAHFAGGVIIAPQWVLTVAHIMWNKQAKDLTVAAGHLGINEDSAFIQRRDVSKLIVHEDYELRDLHNNIAVLKLWMPFDLDTDFVKLAPMGQEMPLPGTQCEVAGWGASTYDSWLASGRLMYSQLPLIEKADCKNYRTLANFIHEGSFCAGYKGGDPAPWLGDEGGALICDETISGLVSMQLNLYNAPEHPGLYVDIPYYYKWVKDQMRIHD